MEMKGGEDAERRGRILCAFSGKVKVRTAGWCSFSRRMCRYLTMSKSILYKMFLYQEIHVAIVFSLYICNCDEDTMHVKFCLRIHSKNTS